MRIRFHSIIKENTQVLISMNKRYTIHQFLNPIINKIQLFINLTLLSFILELENTTFIFIKHHAINFPPQFDHINSLPQLSFTNTDQGQIISKIKCLKYLT